MKRLEFKMKFIIYFFTSLVLLFFVLAPSSVQAESKKAFKLLEKGDYVKLEELLQKSLEKDSINAGAKYVYSLLFLTPKYPDYSIDTAYYFINKAIDNYARHDEKVIENLVKLGINDSSLSKQKRNVELQAFLRAKEKHSIDDYNFFLKKFAGSLQSEDAIAFRNEIAYNDALNQNTYEALQFFIINYSDAVQVEAAKTKYEKLLYIAKTKDKRLESYVRFLRNNANTPFRDDAEKNIFNISTADNDLDSYMTFIEQFPKSKMRRLAQNLMYHVYKEYSSAQGFTNKFNILEEQDSLLSIAQSEIGYLIPIFEMDKYGFSKLNGERLIDFTYTKIKEEYYCGRIQGDFLEVELEDEKMIVSRIGGEIFVGQYDSVEDLGCGALKIKKDGYFGVYHKSGFPLIDFNYEDVGLVANAFIKYKFNGKWGLKSFSNREILPAKFDDIFSEGRFVLVEKNGLYAVQNVENLSKAADLKTPGLDFIYDDYELIYASQLLLFKEDMETVMDLDLKEKIKLGRQSFYELYDGWMVKKKNKFKIYDQIFYPLSDLEFDKVDLNKTSAALKIGNKWGIYNFESKFPTDFTYDSVRFLSEQIGIILKGDTTFAIFENDILDISYSTETRLLRSSTLIDDDEGKYSQYLLTKTNKGIYKVFNIYGRKIIDGKYASIEALGKEYLLIEKSGKKGLFHRSGKLALKIKYNAIGNNDNDYVSTLINGKFGIYNYKKNVFLSAKYEKALKPFGSNYFIGIKGAALGLVNMQNEDVTGYRFDEILDWNDSVALVKEEDQWNLYDIKNDKYIYEGISEYTVLRDDEDEKILMVIKNSQSGILSNKSGVVVGASFNDIINIGTVENPVYFAEKYIIEADFYVIIYYNAKGKILRKQVFTDEKEYAKIYCD